MGRDTSHNIIINATAARESGALTILRQLIAAIKRNRGGMDYLAFVPAGVEFSPADNIRFVAMDTASWSKRIAWDEKGLRRWLDKHNITPTLIVSLQNTGVNYDSGIPQLIYYHQPLPLEPKRWNPLRRDQRIYYFYRNIYPFFVRRHLDKAVSVVVQREGIRQSFSKRFGFDAGKITVLRPDVAKIDCGTVVPHTFNDSCTHMVYPATPLAYKNHRILADAIGILRQRTDIGNLRIHLTIDKDPHIPFVKTIMERQMDDIFLFDGKLTFDDLMSLYKSADALLFPSYIETFGLPLIEAAAFGLPVICSDLPYAHDVLDSYPGATYATYDNPAKWADAIESVMNASGNRHFTPITTGTTSDWDIFLELCKRLALKR